MEQPQKRSRIKKFFKETVRVMRILKKPSREEYKNLVKVTGLGIAIVGIIGFAIFMVKLIVQEVLLK
ncbi:protein translocase SEC61 complex subunit gamma [Candidatus Woesearchaeota archaeon]|nr:protein translocase SEC61 complex subunit gamma [Candidatus Woesearchaeota archaeon]MBT5740587.1 protein translocase SEC61 complex subunit gamma [Candidatus Woesearchaeota archaeon]